jgi:uncharacterized lipoprotein YmbA
MTQLRLGIAGAFVLALTACASPPLHYYTLVPPAPTMGSAESSVVFQFELLPVGIPAQVDQPQLVIRQGKQGVTILNGERWIAPLADEVRSALSTYLAREMNTQDVSGLPVSDRPRLRLKVDLRRFDSVLNNYALIETSWSLRLMRGGATVICTSRIRQPVGPGYDALVQGHQEALRQLAGQIAQVARVAAVGQTPSCQDN